MNARRLDLSQRQFLKRALREQLGDFEYQRLVDQLGEDGLIDAALAQVERPRQEPARRRPVFVESLTWPIMVLGALLGSGGSGWSGLILGITWTICLIAESEGKLLLAFPAAYVAGVVWCGVVAPIWRLLTRR